MLQAGSPYERVGWLSLTFDPAALSGSFLSVPAAMLLGLLPMCWAWRLPHDAPFGEDGWIGLRLPGLLWREASAPACA